MVLKALILYRRIRFYRLESNFLSFGVVCQSCGCIEASCSPCREPGACSNCSSCCCSIDHKFWRLGRIKTGIRLEYLSTGWMSVEVLGALTAGVHAGSLALVAFGADSFVELLSSAVVLSHLRGDVAGSGARGWKTSRFTNILLFLLIPVIAVTGAYSFFLGARPEASPLGIAIASGAALIMPFLWLEKRRIGRETRCFPLSIDAFTSATCFLMSISLLAGLLAEFAFGFWWADYIATAIIVAFIGKEAIESYQEMHTTS